MASALDFLKNRLMKATARKTAAEQRLREAQEELAAAERECEVWSAAIEIETNSRLTPEQARGGKHETQESGRFQKAKLVREAIRKHPDGITPAGLLGVLNGTFSSTPSYLYSVLKRLRDNGEAELLEDGRYVMALDTEESEIAEGG